MEHQGLSQVSEGAAEEVELLLTNQEKKEKLNKYREAEAEASRLEQEIIRWYSKAEKMTTAVKLVPVGGGSGRQVGSAIEAIDTLAGKLADKRKETVGLRREIEDAIAAVPDGRLRMLLRYRYVDGMTWERLAENMGFKDVRQAYRLHGTALTLMAESPSASPNGLVASKST